VTLEPTIVLIAATFANEVLASNYNVGGDSSIFSPGVVL
jgi:hypothetical protein